MTSSFILLVQGFVSFVESKHISKTKKTFKNLVANDFAFLSVNFKFCDISKRFSAPLSTDCKQVFNET